ncbi:TetR/AcrR family transcriptional regulator [Euzebya sp.]|uniref:TetR/AcrR family transcriptional regulator n=1 Tax=Euzebya sp. TaxID=1971409 RepID=UPI0035168C38
MAGAGSARTAGGVDARPGPARSRARRGDGARLRREILDATTRLLVETGDEGAVSVRAVAERVGVTPPSIYLHFGDKGELIFECCRMLMGQLAVRVTEAVEGIRDPVERLRLAAHTFVTFGIENPEPYRITFMSPHHEVPDDFDIESYEGTHAFRLLTDMVADVRSPRVAPADPPHDAPHPTDEMWAMGLLAAFHGVTSLMVAKAVEPIDFPWPEVGPLVDHLLDVHLAAMTAGAAGGVAP